MIKAYSQIPGVRQTTINIANQLPKIETRIYFDSASNKINLASNSSKIKSIAEFLNRYPELNLKLIAYSDGIGSKQINQKLGMERCSNVKDVLLAQGIDSSRLAMDCNTYRDSSRQPNQTILLTRYNEFETFIHTKKPI
ncbi:MAG: OmpA family protein [Pleurocapsa sp.]